MDRAAVVGGHVSTRTRVDRLIRSIFDRRLIASLPVPRLAAVGKRNASISGQYHRGVRKALFSYQDVELGGVRGRETDAPVRRGGSHMACIVRAVDRVPLLRKENRMRHW